MRPNVREQAKGSVDKPNQIRKNIFFPVNP